ncbi:MAG: hypothetical protein C0434_11245 [Xanthomonadaceae bacterium]|nr:hypothetical protein [Xanthomonadaceae bacterium]
MEAGRFFAGEGLAPVDPALAAAGPLDRRIPDPQAAAGDVRTDAVAFDADDDRLQRQLEPASTTRIFSAPAGIRMSRYPGLTALCS